MLPRWVVGGQARHEDDALETRGVTCAPSTTRRLRLRLRNGEARGARPALSKHLWHPCLLVILLLLLLLVVVVVVTVLVWGKARVVLALLL